MPPTVDVIIAEILRREGGYVEHLADRGGPTNMGITLRTLDRWRGRPQTSADLQALTRTEAVAIYHGWYVVPLAFAPDPLRALLVDWAVTSGHDDPVRALQVSLKRRGVYTGAIDGIVGPLTRTALVYDPSPRTTYRDILVARSRFYLDLVFRDPAVQTFLRDHPGTQLHFVRGWNNRVLDFVP